MNVVDNCIYKFLDNIFNKSSHNEAPPKLKKTIRLPFHGHLSYTIRKSLSLLLKSQYPDIKIIFVYTNKLTIGSYFKFKDKIPPVLTSNIIYEFVCSSCKARYFGETKRNLAHRISEHRGVSSRTQRQLANPSFSAVRLHSHEHDHKFTNTDFSVLHKADSYTNPIH